MLKRLDQGLAVVRKDIKDKQSLDYEAAIVKRGKQVKW